MNPRRILVPVRPLFVLCLFGVVFGGPALGLRVGASERGHDLDRRTEMSVVVGIGVDVRVGEGRLETLSLDARYQMGVREVSYRRSAGPTDP